MFLAVWKKHVLINKQAHLPIWIYFCSLTKLLSIIELSAQFLHSTQVHHKVLVIIKVNMKKLWQLILTKMTDALKKYSWKKRFLKIWFSWRKKNLRKLQHPKNPLLLLLLILLMKRWAYLIETFIAMLFLTQKTFRHSTMPLKWYLRIVSHNQEF